MILNSRLRGLLEMDTALRAAERAHAQTGSPESEHRHVTARLRAGHSPHDIMKPHVDAYVKAATDHSAAYKAHRRSMTVPDHLRHHPLDHPDVQPHLHPAIRDTLHRRKQAMDSLHRVAGLIGRRAGEFLGPEHTNALTGMHPSTPPDRLGHIHTIGWLHGAKRTTRAAVGHAIHFPSAEHATAFMHSVRTHYPNQQMDHFEGGQADAPHIVELPPHRDQPSAS